MDTTVIPKSCEAAEISRIMAKKVMDLANSVEPEEAQTLRRLASAYKLPRGILLPSGATYELIPYRAIFRMQSGSEARRLQLFLT